MWQRMKSALIPALLLLLCAGIASAGWQITQVEALGGHSARIALSPDLNEYPRIVHIETVGTDSLRYCEWTGATWVCSEIEALLTAGDDRSIGFDIDALGRGHVAYGTGGGTGAEQKLKYAYQSGSIWVNEIRDGADARGHAASRLQFPPLAPPRPPLLGVAPLGLATWRG